MKTIRIILLILFAGSGKVWAQTDTSKHFPAIEAGWGDLNYAVPESPGFKILGTSPSSIMRPTSVRDIAFSIGNYFTANGAAIPQNLAVELSPKLFHPNVSLNDFYKNRFWYTSALSVGTKVNSDKSYAIGLGIKFRILDFQDLRLNASLINQLNLLGQAGTRSYSEALRFVAKKYMDADTNGNGYQHWRHVVDSIYRLAEPGTATGKVIKQEILDYIKNVGKFNPDRIVQIRDSIKNVLWNKSIWDVGIAALFNSKDSLIRNIKPASKLGLWTTAGFPLGAKGQLLIGATGQLRDTVNSRLGAKSLSIGSRAYYGSNDVKGFVEANGLFQTNQKFTYKASLGIETAFFGGMWVDFSLGISKQQGAKAVFTPGFNLFFGNGERKAASARM
ncbi:hypothetical protein LX99_00642 [Mucilaginibacter oryzae]|uniref:DUF5723 domain-containing protein n=1 Tax=Mucilaginibacter oryzae TaxID=468058 RepID=A0A316HHR8_9SPHI|nr:hypothetical protein [Mucilaginibacter oryzae]PWK80178.1 hypothetical protein LX99_00642 [Mucilaginibacter oryzae]